MPTQVTDRPRHKPNPEMGLIGLLIAAPIALLALPLLPFVAAYWLYEKLT